MDFVLEGIVGALVILFIVLAVKSTRKAGDVTALTTVPVADAQHHPHTHLMLYGNVQGETFPSPLTQEPVLYAKVVEETSRRDREGRMRTYYRTRSEDTAQLQIVDGDQRVKIAADSITFGKTHVAHLNGFGGQKQSQVGVRVGSFGSMGGKSVYEHRVCDGDCMYASGTLIPGADGLELTGDVHLSQEDNEGQASAHKSQASRLLLGAGVAMFIGVMLLSM